MNSVAISVVVPVYNVEDTLERCVESILAQSFKDYEIILVDDGSTDNSGAICDKYVDEYSFISVIHKANEGLGPTRNVGVTNAKGKYIYHCDSDDWISPTLLEDCYNVAEKNNANIVVFGYTIYTEDKDGIKPYQTIKVNNNFYLTEAESKDFFVKQFTNSFVVQSACNRLLKREFLLENNIWFKPFRRCQDVVFSLDLFGKASKVVCLEECYYNYIIVPGVYKGRSYDEMLSIYLDVFEHIRYNLKEWTVWNEHTKKEITSLYMAHIANYVSYYIINKSEHKRKDIKAFINNERICDLFLKDCIKPNSRFLSLTQNGIKFKSAELLLIIFRLHERRKGK